MHRCVAASSLRVLVVVLLTELTGVAPGRVVPGAVRAQRAALACPGGGGGGGGWGPAAVATGVRQAGRGGRVQVGGELEQLNGARGLAQEERAARVVCKLHPEAAVLLDHHARAALLLQTLQITVTAGSAVSVELGAVRVVVVIVLRDVPPSDATDGLWLRLLLTPVLPRAAPRPSGDVVVVSWRVRLPALWRGKAPAAYAPGLVA